MAVRQIVKNARKNDGIPKTAQQSIPFDRMFPDGICRVGLDYYTKTVQFQDINYQLAQQEDKTEIFDLRISKRISLITSRGWEYRRGA